MARKKTQVVLSQDVPKLGNNGDLVEVAPGYARNFLFPRSLAFRVTPGVLKQVEIRREKERQRLEAIKQEAESIKTALTTIGLFTVKKAVGEDDAIFGTVTTAEVADLIQANAGKEVDRRDITLPDINKLGDYKVDIKLHSDVTATINLRVVAD
jgi:large subunit ribosomal protein L9